MRNLWAFAAGALFGTGLLLSGMTRPSKIIGFLDIAGAWDGSLALVMVGAIAVHLVASRRILRRSAPLFDRRFHLPDRRDIDERLIAGAIIFGVGWGIAGYCPGPGLVGAAAGALPALVFVAAMIAGMLVHDRQIAGRL